MPWAQVLGAPVGHSLSPALHAAAYQALGLREWTYDRREVTADALPAVLAEAGRDPGWGGFSLTMPLKEAVLPLLAAERSGLGAVNTVVPGPFGPVGWNTDVDGVAWALGLLGLGSGGGRPAAVLGAGGTARAAVVALQRLGWVPVVVARRPLPPLLGSEVLPWSGFRAAAYPLVVSTVPAGATDALAREGWPGGTALLDVLYDPWPTALAAAATAGGAPVLGGLPVLAGQAARQVALMTGWEVDAAVLLAAGEHALAERQARG